ncbi:MAG: alkaline phosphatase [Geovibrio sp.]|nr:alkaline phosphatase [Geovibrio sp.]
MKTKLFKLLLLVLTLSVLAACGSDGNDGSTGKDGQDGEDAWALPKHVILFIGDGMHEEHEAAASRYYYGDETSLVWKDSSVFPYSNYATTWDVTAYNTLASERSEASYAADTFSGRTGFDVLQMGLSSITKDKYFLDSSMGAAATDSASAGTAIATGVKTDAGNIAWESGDPANGEIQTIAEYYKAKTTPGKIGVVTTVPISHATPAAFVSHNVYRNNYHAIFTEISTVTKPDVVIGGGHPQVYNETYLTTAQLTTVQGDASYEYVARNTGTDGATALAAATANAVTNGTGLFGVFGSAGGQIATPHSY